MQIIRHKEFRESISYALIFDLVDEPSHGYGFTCDKEGVVNIEKLCETARRNYQSCLDKTHNVKKGRIDKSHHTWSTPTVGLCDCGREIELDHFTNTCDCGKDYNSAGQELASRSQWGEETGESVSDILLADNYNLDNDDY